MNRKKAAAALAGVLLSGLSMNCCVTAAPSIDQLQNRAEAEIDPAQSDDGTNTAEILAREGIYVDCADSTEYMIIEEGGVLVPTKLSEVIEAAKETQTETKENGKSIVEDIPTVEEILSVVNADAGEICKEEYNFDLTQMQQLTYMLDMKYITSNRRVAAGEKVGMEDYAVFLDNGMVRARIYGGEILRLDDEATISLIHINEQSEKITVLQMEEYDSQTGTYMVTFPGIGPYMVVQERLN